MRLVPVCLRMPVILLVNKIGLPNNLSNLITFCGNGTFDIFTGHMIDVRDRKSSRPPVYKENVVREAIRLLIWIGEKAAKI